MCIWKLLFRFQLCAQHGFHSYFRNCLFSSLDKGIQGMNCEALRPTADSKSSRSWLIQIHLSCAFHVLAGFYLLWHRLSLSLVTPTTSCSISCSISCDTDTCGHTPWMSWSTCLPPTVVCGRLSRAPEATHRDPPVSFPPESELRLKPGVPAAGVHSNGQGLARFLPKVFALKGLSSHGAHRQEPYTLSSESVLPNLCLG